MLPYHDKWLGFKHSYAIYSIDVGLEDKRT